MSLALPREKRISVRLIWPFIRVTGVHPSFAQAYAHAGFGMSAFVNPDTRIPHRLAMDVLRDYVNRTGDVTVGLRAGRAVDPADLEPLEMIARSSATLREAIECSGRYVHILNEAAEVSFLESREHTLWRFRTTDDVRWPASGHDFVLACAATLTQRAAGVHRTAIEVHMMRERPADVQPYVRFFGVRVRFGMPHDGFLMRTSELSRPMLNPSPVVRAAFEERARLLLEQLRLGIRQEVARLVVAQLPTGEVSMHAVARELAMSVATLRRRLADEGESFSGVVDEARRSLAEGYLRNPRVSISQIAYLLGFAHVPAFSTAFRRWYGATPSDFRASALKSERSSRAAPPLDVPTKNGVSGGTPERTNYANVQPNR